MAAQNSSSIGVEFPQKLPKCQNLAMNSVDAIAEYLNTINPL
jgi:hypothetical protein